MAITLRNKRIAKLFRFVSGEERFGLATRQSLLRRRTKAALTLSRLLAGRNQVIRLRKLIREIEAAAKAEFDAGRLSATEVQSISKLAASAYAQLAEADRKRQARSKPLTEAEFEKLYEDAEPPFEGLTWFKHKDSSRQRVLWYLVSPVPLAMFQVVTQQDAKTLEEKLNGTISEEATIPAA